MIENIVNWLVNLIDKLGYPGIAISMFIESFFAPVPSELIMPFGGFLASKGEMDLILLAIIGGVASYLGTLPFYFLGYIGNEVILNKFIRKYGKYLFISENDVEKGFEIFTKYGNGIVLLGRLVPIVRTVISFPAGVTKMHFFEFSVYTLLGATIWSGFLATLGYFLGDNWEDVVGIMSQYEHVMIGVGVIVLLAFFGSKLLKKAK